MIFKYSVHYMLRMNRTACTHFTTNLQLHSKYSIAGGSLVNLANHPRFAKLKPSKLVLTIDNILADLLIHQFFHQILESSNFTKLSCHTVVCNSLYLLYIGYCMVGFLNQAYAGHRPGHAWSTKIFCVYVYTCACVVVCVSTPDAINNQRHNMDPI